VNSHPGFLNDSKDDLLIRKAQRGHEGSEITKDLFAIILILMNYIRIFKDEIN